MAGIGPDADGLYRQPVVPAATVADLTPSRPGDAFSGETDHRADNAVRAAQAATALLAYAEERASRGEEPGTVVADMVSDMAHLCDRLGLDFDDVIQRGQHYHEQEVRVDI